MTVVPQECLLAPVFYLAYALDIPYIHNVKCAAFSDDTAILAVHRTVDEYAGNLQQAANNI